MPYNRHRRDKNHSELKEAFEDMGCSVLDLSQQGNGAPDLLVGCVGNHLVEIKQPKGKVSGDQVDWARAWRGGAVYLCRCVEDVVALVSHWRDGAEYVEVVE